MGKYIFFRNYDDVLRNNTMPSNEKRIRLPSWSSSATVLDIYALNTLTSNLSINHKTKTTNNAVNTSKSTQIWAILSYRRQIRSG